MIVELITQNAEIGVGGVCVVIEGFKKLFSKSTGDIKIKAIDVRNSSSFSIAFSVFNVGERGF